MSRRTVWILAGIAFVVFVVPVIQSWKDSPPRHGPPPARPVCEEWARKVEQTISAGDPSFLDGTLDMRAILEKAVEGLNFSSTDRKAFIEAAMKSPDAKLGKRISEGMAGKGSYKFLRLVEEGGRTLARFRMYSGGLNYHDYLLASDTKGQVAAIDVYVYLSGEDLSRTFHRLAAMGTGKGQGGSRKDFQQLTALVAHVREGRAAEALQDYDSLPPALKREKFAMLFRVMAASKVGEEQYAAAMDDYRQQFPDDASVDLVSIDLLFLREKYAEAQKSLDRLEAKVGADLALDHLRANCWLSMGELAKARQMALLVTGQDPRFVDSYWTLVTVALKQKDYPEVARVLTILEKDLQAELPDLQETPAYANFIQSDEYAKWARSRPSSAAPTQAAEKP